MLRFSFFSTVYLALYICLLPLPLLECKLHESNEFGGFMAISLAPRMLPDTLVTVEQLNKGMKE